MASEKLRLECSDVLLREFRRDEVVRSLEELVDDLHLLSAAAEARERVHEPLDPVVRLDDFAGVGVEKRVRLVVDDECSLAVMREHVQSAVEKHAVVFERERALGRAPGSQAARPVASVPQYASLDELRDPIELCFSDQWVPRADRGFQLGAAGRRGVGQRDDLEETVDGVAHSFVATRPPADSAVTGARWHRGGSPATRAK